LSHDGDRCARSLTVEDTRSPWWSRTPSISLTHLHWSWVVAGRSLGVTLLTLAADR
jgi:hypothetical protein